MYLVCILQAQPDYRETLLASLEALVQHSRTEPGTLHYEVLTDIEDPYRIIVFERYTAPSALADHLNSLPVSQALAKFDEYLAQPPILIKSALKAGFIRSGLANQI